jgi:two-component system OmpR family response regulator
VLSRDQLLDLSQGREAEPLDRSIDVQVSRLRQRLGDDPREPALIKTVRGEGYVLTSRRGAPGAGTVCRARTVLSRGVVGRP